MRNTQQPIVVKKSSNKSHGHGPGGAWKVAFADFTLAMMAFFMVLWIISSASKPELEKAAKHIREYSVFDGTTNPFKFEGRGTPMNLEVNPDVLETTASSMLSGSSSDEAFQNMVQQIGGENAPLVAAKELVEEMAKKLDAEENLSVEIVPQGLRIRLHDDENRQMFGSGSSNMSPFFEDLLIALTPVFSKIDNKMVISGHTDAVPYSRFQYTNWELSGDRAMTARQVLAVGGMSLDKILQVSGMADRALAKTDEPNHSMNRRIELMLLTREAEEELMSIFKFNDPEKEIDGEPVSNAREAAEFNQPVTR